MSIIDNNPKPLITVDFDDTLCESDFPLCGPPKEGGREALMRFRELGYLIMIDSCRTCHWHYKMFGGEGIPVMERPHVIEMRNWLIEHDIPFDEINDGSRGKPLAAFSICDKAVRYENNWAEITKFVEQRTKQ